MKDNSYSFEQVLSQMGKLVYTNVGVSMRPLLREGKDVLVVEKRDVSTLKNLDVVLFRRKGVKGRGEYILHRIVKILPDGKYLIAGDNCFSGEIVEKEQILGVLTAVRRGKRNIDFGKTGYKLYLYFWCKPYRIRFLILKAKSGIKYFFYAVFCKLTGK